MSKILTTETVPVCLFDPPDATLTFNQSHTYGDDGTYTGRICAADPGCPELDITVMPGACACSMASTLAGWAQSITTVPGG